VGRCGAAGVVPPRQNLSKIAGKSRLSGIPVVSGVLCVDSGRTGIKPPWGKGLTLIGKSRSEASGTSPLGDVSEIVCQVQPPARWPHARDLTYSNQYQHLNLT